MSLSVSGGRLPAVPPPERICATITASPPGGCARARRRRSGRCPPPGRAGRPRRPGRRAPGPRSPTTAGSRPRLLHHQREGGGIHLRGGQLDLLVRGAVALADDAPADGLPLVDLHRVDADPGEGEAGGAPAGRIRSQATMPPGAVRVVDARGPLAQAGGRVGLHVVAGRADVRGQQHPHHPAAGEPGGGVVSDVERSGTDRPEAVGRCRDVPRVRNPPAAPRPRTAAAPRRPG